MSLHPQSSLGLPASLDPNAPASTVDAPQNGGDVLRLEEFLPYRMNVLASQLTYSLSRIFGARYGLGIPEWRIMVTIGQLGTVTARDVGAHSHMHKTKVSRAVASLEERGLITRTINKDDLREAFLSLTDSGLLIYRDLIPVARAFEQRLIACLETGELQTLNRLVDRLTAHSAIQAAPGQGRIVVDVDD